MTSKKATAEMRRCIGSKTYGIEAHDAPITDFPKQPSQKDGLGRMRKPHWTQYTGALRKAALERKAAEAEATPQAEPDPVAAPEPESTKAPRRRQKVSIAEALSDQDSAEELLDALGGPFATAG